MSFFLLRSAADLAFKGRDPLEALFVDPDAEVSDRVSILTDSTYSPNVVEVEEVFLNEDDELETSTEIVELYPPFSFTSQFTGDTWDHITTPRRVLFNTDLTPALKFPQHASYRSAIKEVVDPDHYWLSEYFNRLGFPPTYDAAEFKKRFFLNFINLPPRTAVCLINALGSEINESWIQRASRLDYLLFQWERSVMTARINRLGTEFGVVAMKEPAGVPGREAFLMHLFSPTTAEAFSHGIDRIGDLPIYVFNWCD